MNLPNFLTVLRIFLTGVFIVVILQAGFAAKLLAAGIFLIAALTDLLDGYIAKKYNLISDFGKFMDPMADKLLVLSAFFVFVQMHVVPKWMFVLIFAREVLVTAFRFSVAGQGKVLAAEAAGKYKTFTQMVVIGIILSYLVLRESNVSANWPSAVYYSWDNVIYLLMIVAVALTLISGLLYLWRNRQFLHVQPK